MGEVVQLWQRSRAELMSASELLYFHDAPYAHVVAWEDHHRAERVRMQIDAHRRRR
jgi:hypothetical protein